MSQKQRIRILTFGVITLLLGYEVVLAQTATEQLVRDQRAVVRPRPDRGETVINRTRPEFDPLGVDASRSSGEERGGRGSHGQVSKAFSW